MISILLNHYLCDLQRTLGLLSGSPVQDNFLLVMDELSLRTMCRQKIKNDIFTISLPIVRCKRLVGELDDEYRVYSFELNEQKEAMTLSLDRWLWHIQEHEKDKEIYKEKDEQTLNYWMCDKEQKFFGVMNEIKAQLFQLTKEEMFLLHRIMYFNSKTEIDRALLEELVKIDQKSPFLVNFEKNFCYKFKKIYSLKNKSKKIISFLRKRMPEEAIYVYSFFVVPLIMLFVSKFIEAKFCQKIIDEQLVMQNAKQALLNKLIQDAGCAELFDHIQPLKNVTENMIYSWLDIMKIHIPFLFHLPIIGFLLLVDRGKIRFDYSTINSIAMAAIVPFVVMLAFSYLPISLLMCLVPIVLIVPTRLIGRNYSLFKTKIKNSDFRHIPDLLKRTDIVIS